MSGEHWYTQDGQSAHSQPTKSKSAKNPTRPTTIRDAKELKLLPSVTSILRTIANPALDRWKQMQVVKACIDRPIVADEEWDDYTSYILEKAQEEAQDAADLGSKIHAGIENRIKGITDSKDDEIKEYVDSGMSKLAELGLEVHESEFVTVSPKYGYAGTCDLAYSKGKVCGIVDFKSKRTKKDEPVVPSFGHAAQIAAYHVSYWSRDGDIRDNSIGYNVYISTTEPGRVEVVSYDAATMRKEFSELFLPACQVWRYKNNYDPRLA